MLRESMLQQGHGKALVVLEGLFMKGLQQSEHPNYERWYTTKDIITQLKYFCGMSETLVREGLNDVLVFQRRVKASEGRNQRGRPPYEYRLPLLKELLAEFAYGLMWTPGDELVKEDLVSLRDYRMALHREMVIRNWEEKGGFEMYRDLMADRLGVSKRTIRNYDNFMGFVWQANFVGRRITFRNWVNLPRYKHRYDENGKRLPSRHWLRIYDPVRGQFYHRPNVRYLAWEALEKGHDVELVHRGANTYYPYGRPCQSEFNGEYGDMQWVMQNIQAIEDAGFVQSANGQWHHQRE